MKLAVKAGLLLILGFFSVLMIRITLPYLAFDDHVAFLRIKQWIIHNPVWKSAFYIHVTTSSFCLIAGFTQFSKTLRTRLPAIHRYAGWLYASVIILFAGPSGFIMSLYANGGLLSQTAFTTLSLLWIFFTIQAFRFVKQGNFMAHRNYMIRSFALTLSAITLRAWKFVIVLAFRPQPMDAYMLVAWLGWVPNLLVAEWYIRKGVHAYFKKKRHPNLV